MAKGVKTPRIQGERPFVSLRAQRNFLLTWADNQFGQWVRGAHNFEKKWPKTSTSQ